LHNLRKENYGAALDDFTHAIELDPENASMYCNRGLVYDHEGDNEKAILEYDRAIELDPKESELYYMRAKSYKSKGDLKAARRDLQRAAKMGDGRARKELENL
jgi:Flp pilus assembly protein TadD